MYKVTKLFADLQDNNHVYNVGDEYPRKGLKVTDERIAELAGSNNKQGTPLIVSVATATTATATETKPAAQKAKKAAK